MKLLKGTFHFILYQHALTEFFKGFREKNPVYAEKMYKSALRHGNALNKIGVEYESKVNPIDFTAYIISFHLDYLKGEITREEYLRKFDEAIEIRKA